MKIIVDRLKCSGEAVCTGVAPEVFELDEERRAIIIDPHGADDDTVVEAAYRCPPQAIIVIDEETGEQVYP